MPDQQPWGGKHSQPGGQDQYGQDQYGQDQYGQPGQWAQAPQTPQHAAPQHAQQKGAGLAALRPLFTPLNAGIGAGVLFLLTVLTFFLSWKSMDEDGDKATVNGFGIQKISAEGETMRGLATGLYAVGLVVVLLIAAAAVLAVTTAYQRIAALCLTVAGGIGVLYSFLSLFTDFGMDTKFMGSEAGAGDDALDWGLSFGIFLALVVSLATVAFGVLYFLTAQGPLLPAAVPSAPATGLAAVLRPVYVAGGVVVLFLLLTLSYILSWRKVDEEGGELSVNGLGVRTTKFDIYDETVTISDLGLLPLLTATLTFALLLLGALVLAATPWKKIGGLLVAVGAALALLTAFVGLVSDFGMFREMAGESYGGLEPDTSAAVGVFLALLFSLVLLVVAVLYLLVDFGIIGGATPQQDAQARFGQQQFGQGQFGQPAPGQWSQQAPQGQQQWNQYGQQPGQPGQPGQPQQGQQYPPQNPGQTPPAQGRW